MGVDIDMGEERPELWIEAIEISGYGPFSRFTAPLLPLTLIVGENGSGKSSLFDALRLLSHVVENPIPPGIDPWRPPDQLFHIGGPKQIELAVTVTRGSAAPLRYELTIEGFASTPRVARERLATMQIAGDCEESPFVFLDFHDGKGRIQDARVPMHELSVPLTELALRRARDPALVTLSQFRDFVGSWRFHRPFDVSPSSAMRKPSRTCDDPIFAEDGSNLAAVQAWLELEHPKIWDELNEQMREAVPGFASLEPRPDDADRMATVFYRERGLDAPLTLHTMSTGTLNVLGLLTLAAAPSPAPVICFDEPEIHLHPRALPVLATALKRAAARCQVLVATHSRALLEEFGIQDVAGMRKDYGRATFDTGTESVLAHLEKLGGQSMCLLMLEKSRADPSAFHRQGLHASTV
jgi:predicted ATPase